MADWFIVGLITILASVFQIMGWKCLRELEAINQRVTWIQEDLQKMGEKS